MEALDKLLNSERDQNANDDDADLAREFAPAVQRFGDVEMHADPPEGEG
jgi:hypothetical protein